MKLKLFVLCTLGLLAGCPQENTQTTQQPVQPAQPATSQPVQQVQPAQPTEPAQQAAAPVGPDEGKKLFMMGCANCHGPDGTGAMMRQMLPKIGDLTSAEMHTRLKDPDIAALITTGRDKMPPFGAVFKPEQIQAIVAYVRTLKKG